MIQKLRLQKVRIQNPSDGGIVPKYGGNQGPCWMRSFDHQVFSDLLFD